MVAIEALEDGLNEGEVGLLVVWERLGGVDVVLLLAVLSFVEVMPNNKVRSRKAMNDLRSGHR